MNNLIGKVTQGDCLEVMQGMPDKCVDLIVTSPPYDNLRNYDGYSFDFKNIAKEMFRVIKDGGVAVWVVGDSVENGSETGTSFRQALYFKEIGFNLHDTMIYQKNAMIFPEQTRYISCFEYMFVLSKGKPKTVNLIKEKTLNFDKSATSYRQKDGSVLKNKYEIGKEYRSRFNVWIYEVGYNKTTKDKFAFNHPAMFPEKLAQDHIVSWSNENDIVMDIFCGSGTVPKMALLNNRQFVGIEISESYCTIARERIKKEQDQLKLPMEN